MMGLAKMKMVGERGKKEKRRKRKGFGRIAAIGIDGTATGKVGSN
jgi:hypothetical protein